MRVGYTLTIGTVKKRRSLQPHNILTRPHSTTTNREEFAMTYGSRDDSANVEADSFEAGEVNVCSQSETTIDPFEHLPFERRRQLPLLSHEEVCALSVRIRAGDRHAFDTLVTRNEGLAHWVAYRYRTFGIPHKDLVQEGMIGLMTAAKRFNPSRGNKFSTYAFHEVRKEINEHVMHKGRLIRLPVHMQIKIRRVLRAITDIELRGVRATREQIALELNLTEKQVRGIFAALMVDNVVSLDDAVHEDENSRATTYGEHIAHKHAAALISSFEASAEITNGLRRISHLTKTVSVMCGVRNCKIFLYRYGLTREREVQNNAMVSQHFNLTRERVRQILGSMWRRLSQHASCMNERELLLFMHRLPILEVAAGLSRPLSFQEVGIVAVGGERVQKTRRKDDFVDMVGATVREVVKDKDPHVAERKYQLFAFRYCLEHGSALRTVKETADHFGLTHSTVTVIIVGIWRRLKPYVKHINNKKLIESIWRLRIQG